jgi:hypothetical protein
MIGTAQKTLTRVRGIALLMGCLGLLGLWGCAENPTLSSGEDSHTLALQSAAALQGGAIETIGRTQYFLFEGDDGLVAESGRLEVTFSAGMLKGEHLLVVMHHQRMNLWQFKLDDQCAVNLPGAVLVTYDTFGLDGGDLVWLGYNPDQERWKELEFKFDPETNKLVANIRHLSALLVVDGSAGWDDGSAGWD